MFDRIHIWIEPIQYCFVRLPNSDVSLVGGFKHFLNFPFHIWDVILPIDEVIFFKMVF